RCSVELAAHLSEPVVHRDEPAVHFGELVVHPRTEVGNFRPEVGEVFAHRVEAGGRGPAEIPDLRADLGHVTVSPTSQHPRGCRILLATTNPRGQLLPLCLQGSHPRLQIIGRSHDGKPTAAEGKIPGAGNGLWTRTMPCGQSNRRPGATADSGTAARSG